MAAYLYVRNARRAPFARKLARRLGIGVVDGNLMPRFRDNNALICWGNSTPPDWRRPRGYFWLANTPEQVSVAAHKTRTLDVLSEAGVPTLDYTTQRDTAIEWFRNGSSVYARTLLQSHSGEGLVFLDPENNTEQDIVQAPLYTRDFGTPFKEYRLHVAFGRVIDITQKKRLSDEEILARDLVLPAHRERLQVRTYGNGWVFTRHDIRDHQHIRDLAIQAAQALGNMPMAVVDIVAEWRGAMPMRMAVVEVNTAPALRSDTLLEAYVEAFRPHIDRTTPVPFDLLAGMYHGTDVPDEPEPEEVELPIPVPEPIVEEAPLIRRNVVRTEYSPTGTIIWWLSDNEFIEMDVRAA